ncbi:MAG: conjugative transposon protein TraM [Bacteroidetes bacterium]|nr:conjugative transposon protein TraM [Bacteroidota bacterium]
MVPTKSPDARQKKMLLVLPLIAIPFLAMFFWALGGGKNASANPTNGAAGLNTRLPGAKLKNDSDETKLSLYQQAEKDSLQFREAASNDPYYHADTANKTGAGQSPGIIPAGGAAGAYQPFVSKKAAGTANSLAENEARVNLQLAQLKQQLNQPQPPVTPPPAERPAVSDARLQQLQAALQATNGNNAADPQLQQLSRMLDKIKDIQNPGLARERMKAESEKNRGEVFPVTVGKEANPLSTLQSDSGKTTSGANGFFSLSDQQQEDNSQNTIGAVVAATQTLVNGSTIKLRIVNDIYVDGRLIPQNTFVYGTAELSGERLGIKIKSIRYQKSLFPVSLSVYDMDGQDGIYIPGAITRDVAKESADESVQSLGVLNYDPSLGAQAANAGITAAKTLFSRKVRLVKVTVKAGYQVLLRDEKQQQNNQ